MNYIKEYFEKKTYISGPKEFSLNSKITFNSRDYNFKVLDRLPIPLVISSQNNEQSTIYHVSSTNFHFNLIHDQSLVFDYSTSSKNITLYPIKYIDGKTLTYIVSFKYEKQYDLIFQLSPFAVNTITVLYHC